MPDGVRMASRTVYTGRTARQVLEWRQGSSPILGLMTGSQSYDFAEELFVDLAEYVRHRLTAYRLRLRRRAGLVGGLSRAMGGSPRISAGVLRPRSVRSKSASKLTRVRSFFLAATYW
jgi:hypothetical protein